MNTRPIAWSPAGVLMVVVLAATASPAWCGDIEGEIRLPAREAPRPAANPYPGRVSGAHAAAAHRDEGDERGALTDAVIYIESLEAPFPFDPPDRPSMAQRGQRFVPRVLPVMVRQVVDFPNEDPVYHNVFSYSPCCRFDLGRYPKGKSKQVTFDETGVVRVFCEIHADMAGYIVVLQNPCFAVPDANGRYHLHDVPPGARTLVFWNPEIGRRAWPITVPGSGTVKFDIGL